MIHSYTSFSDEFIVPRVVHIECIKQVPCEHHKRLVRMKEPQPIDYAVQEPQPIGNPSFCPAGCKGADPSVPDFATGSPAGNELPTDSHAMSVSTSLDDSKLLMTKKSLCCRGVALSVFREWDADADAVLMALQHIIQEDSMLPLDTG